MMNESPVRAPAEARRRGLLLLWVAQLGSLALLFFLTYIVRPEASTDGNRKLAWTLGAVGFMSFALSIPLRYKLLAQAAAKHRPDLGTTAYVLAFAMCETTAIIGFVSYLITGLSFALHSFNIAAVGMLLHFPTRGALDGSEANGTGANFKSTL